jgi:outer membrane protein OmpA-like peptidoglycan-associated protein
MAYLVNKGLSEKRLIANGYGETKSIASNDSETGRKLNRRIEFKILEN